MELALLYSGEEDSLAAHLLDRFYDVRCVTGSFGLTDDWKHAERAAAELGFPFERVELDRGVAEEAIQTMIDDGYPRNGIQRVHEHALETIASRDADAIADGTRRDDDRVPTVSRAQAQSLEDRHAVDTSPLSGSVVTPSTDRLVGDVRRPAGAERGGSQGRLRGRAPDAHRRRTR